jgi:hypothetical protein
MISETLKFRSLAEHYLGPDWLWGLALAEHESGGNPWAVGDGGLAAGVVQQHPDFQETYFPTMEDHLWPLTDQRWHPAFQFACLATFWKKNAVLPVDQRLEKYNLGHVGPDPDYVAAVHHAYDQIKAITG